MFEAVTITCDTIFLVWCQRGTCSNEINIGATNFERGRCEGERSGREALLGGSGSLPGKILKSWYCLVVSDASFWYF